MLWNGQKHFVSYKFVSFFVGVLIYIFTSVFVYTSGIKLRGIGIRRTTGSSGHLSFPTSSRECACASGNDPIRFLRQEERRARSRVDSRLRLIYAVNYVAVAADRRSSRSVVYDRPTECRPTSQPTFRHTSHYRGTAIRSSRASPGPCSVYRSCRRL